MHNSDEIVRYLRDFDGIVKCVTINMGLPSVQFQWNCVRHNSANDIVKYANLMNCGGQISYGITKYAIIMGL